MIPNNKNSLLESSLILWLQVYTMTIFYWNKPDLIRISASHSFLLLFLLHVVFILCVSLHPYCGPQGSNSDDQTCWQVPLLSNPSCHTEWCVLKLFLNLQVMNLHVGCMQATPQGRTTRVSWLSLHIMWGLRVEFSASAATHWSISLALLSILIFSWLWVPILI